MTSTSIRGGASLLITCVLLIATTTQAETIGWGEVSVTRFAGMPFQQRINVPPDTLDFTTPAAELAARLPDPGSGGTLAEVRARAVTGLDIPAGALFSSLSTFARAEVIGSSIRAFAQSRAVFEDTFEVRSDTLPNGTAVEVVVTPEIALSGSVSSTGLAPCCAIGSVYSIIILGGSTTSGDNPTDFGRTGVLVGDDLKLNFGGVAIPTSVGDQFYFRINVKFESEAIAAGGIDRDGRLHKGQSDSAATAAVLFATEVMPVAAGLAAADAVAAEGGADGSAGYLFHASSGLRLPGREALDPANIEAHLLPLVSVPEPPTMLLGILSLCGFLLIRRQHDRGGCR